ncbi:MAG: hypothetical protein A4E32_00210 [Methanomassiliicoccales archaeon PtaU1.Bin124]|nr:MAG: hypothetical protein A4E32_00210 [Methanomassiliicoccales archaeon PtaU1.Bin124]
MKEKGGIKVPKEKKDEMVAKIKEFYRHERGEEISELASNILLSFIIEELAPEFYNIGVEDSYRYMGERVEDLLSIQKVR